MSDEGLLQVPVQVVALHVPSRRVKINTEYVRKRKNGNKWVIIRRGGVKSFSKETSIKEARMDNKNAHY